MDLHWLIKVFKSLIREKAAGQRRLLIIDKYKNHIQANFIVYYIQNDIDLLIMPPYYSHIL